jgi:drug/metabolite transporter (DMT)-like permease
LAVSDDSHFVRQISTDREENHKLTMAERRRGGPVLSSQAIATIPTMNSSFSSAKLPLLVLLWYISNTLASYLTKKAFTDDTRSSTVLSLSSSSISIDDASLVLLVSLVQLFLSGILGLAYAYLKGPSPSPMSMYWAALRGEDAHFFWLMTSIGMCNAVGLVTTNVGYLFGSVSLVQLIKAMEPVATFVSDILILKSGKTQSFTTFFGVVLVIAGATSASYHDPTFNLISVVAACISNAILPLRNIFVKYYDERSESKKGKYRHDHLTGFVLFSLVSMIGAFIVGIFFLGTLAFHSSVPAVSSWSVMSALAYYGYNAFSFSVLHLVDPVLHAVLNVFKRAFVIVTSMVAFGKTPSLRFLFALLVMTVGLFVYLIGKKKIDTERVHRMLSGLYGRYALVLVLLTGVTFFPLLDRQELSPRLNGTGPVQGIQSTRSVASVSQSNAFHDLVAVPLEPYNACNDHILHVSCLKTIVVNGAVNVASPLVPVVSSLYPQVCDDLEQQTHDATKWQLEEAHCMLCLQANGVVSVLVESTPLKDRISRYLLPAEASRVAATIVPGGVSHRIVDRKTIVITQWYKPWSWDNNYQRGVDSNRGNMIWQYGATRLINPFTTLFLGKESASSSTAVALVLATANALRLDEPSEESMSYIDWHKMVQGWDVPTILLGIGIQKEFSADFSPADLELFEFQRAQLQEIERRQSRPAIAVRGNLTSIACENSDVSHCVVMGCPSLTISTLENLGATMDAKWKTTLKKLDNGETIKMALALPALSASMRHEGDKKRALHKTVMDLFVNLAKHHDAIVVIQDGSDLHWLEKWPLLKHAHNVSFDNAEQWFNLTSNVDLVLSGRIHGGMAGIASSAPTLVIPTDLRIRELVDAMLIPSLSAERINSDMDVATLLRLANVDFKAFEANRRQRILQYIGILREADLEMNPKLLEVVKDASNRELNGW